MFLNFLAGAIALVLAISAFIPWVTIWIYSLKGIESIYGICILVAGILGLMVAVFQHLSGKNRGRVFIACSLISLISEGLYLKKIATYGARLNEIVSFLNDLFGEAVITKIQQLLGEQWTKTLSKIVNHFGLSTNVNSFDFIGGGLILAAVCATALLVVGIILEVKAGKAASNDQ